ncbi:MAG TPA: helix-turn-helix domain-containing protein [Candidatus Limnocylindria bacterium]|nr:helix-turn-helix domain-containing protein [Candidatus Limnocylindria bacterium]
MSTRERPIDRGTARGRRSVVDVGREVRDARLDRGLTLEEVGRATRSSASAVSRLERGQAPAVSLLKLSHLCAVVGLDLSVRTYPGGQPIRDAAQVALLMRFRARLHHSIRWAAEVPLPRQGDQRAWDGLVSGSGWRFGIEAESAPRDAQGLARRLELKRRDGDVDGVILVLPNTRRTRHFLQETGVLLASAHPVNGVRALELLGAGVSPGGSAIVVI